MAAETPRRPWEQREGEPAEAHAWLAQYLGLGPRRSLAELASRCGRSLSLLKRLSASWNWPARAQAWDEHSRRERQRTQLREAAQARARLRQQAAEWQAVARGQMASWVRRGPDGQLRLTRELTPSEALRLWRVGCEAELELRGGREPQAPAGESPRQLRQREVQRLRAAVQQACSHLVALGASREHREQLERALLEAMAASIVHVGSALADPQDALHALLPYHLPFAQA